MSDTKRINWVNTTFLAVVHVAAIAGTVAYLTLRGPSWAAVGIAAFYFFACGLSMTGGYHRLFSHVAYKAHPLVKAFYLFFGAAQFENSALKWSADHRRHHSETDKDGDPYNIQKGFWWAHITWVLVHDDQPSPLQKHRDLTSDPLVMFQHRHYMSLGVFAGFVLPTAVGGLLGDAWGALVLAGFFRLVVLYHSTFCVNSVAHWIGSQPYSDRDSSRDSFVTALLSMGEGYHNYHHRFPVDYRNGVRFWQFDPTKWAIRAMSWVGLTWDLRRIQDSRILQARLDMDAKRVTRTLEETHPHLAEAVASARESLDRVVERWAELKAQAAELRRRKDAEARVLRAELNRELSEARAHLRESVANWRRMLAELQMQAASG